MDQTDPSEALPGAITAQDHYASLVQSSEDAIIAKELDSRVMIWNEAAERLFGYTSEEMIGQSMRRLIPDDRMTEEDHILERIRAGERVGRFFTRRLHKDGHELDVSVTVSPIRDRDGQIVGASKIARDAGPYLADQHKLEEREEWFRMLADNIVPFAWIADAEGNIFWYNDRWFEYTGTTLEEMQGWGWKKVHHPDHVERVVEKISHCFDTGEPWEDTFPLRGADGEYRWFLSRAMPIRRKNGTIRYWFGTNTDITQEREQAEQIRLLLNEVNHRSKNMLATVLALARRGFPADDPATRAFANRIRSMTIAQDMLVKRQWSAVPLDELIHQQLEFVEDADGSVKISGPDVGVNAKAAETLGMAIHELATNSLKHGALSVPGGHVDIGWEHGDDGGFALWWRESNGPPVKAPERKGFGTTLIREVPMRAFGLETDIHYHSEGVCWEAKGDSAAFAAMTVELLDRAI